MLMFRASARVKLGVAAAPRVSRVFFFSPRAVECQQPAFRTPRPRPLPRTPPNHHAHRLPPPLTFIDASSRVTSSNTLSCAAPSGAPSRRSSSSAARAAASAAGRARLLTRESSRPIGTEGGRGLRGARGREKKTARNAGQPGGRPCGIYGARGRCRAVAAFVELVESGPWRKGGNEGGGPRRAAGA